MEIDKHTKGLTDRQKNDLKAVKTKEELDALISSAGLELSDDELDGAAGGVSYCNENCNDFTPGGPGFYCQNRIGTLF